MSENQTESNGNQRTSAGERLSTGTLARWARTCANQSGRVMLIGALTFIALLAATVLFHGSLRDQFEIPGSDTQKAIDLIETQFASEQGGVLNLVFAAPPPSSPFDWGKEGRVSALLGDAFDLELEVHVNTFRAESAEGMWELFSTSYGPTKTLAEAIGERREDRHRDWIEFFDANYSESGEIAHTRDYLLVSGIRR